MSFIQNISLSSYVTCFSNESFKNVLTFFLSKIIFNMRGLIAPPPPKSIFFAIHWPSFVLDFIHQSPVFCMSRTLIEDKNNTFQTSLLIFELIGDKFMFYNKLKISPKSFYINSIFKIKLLYNQSIKMIHFEECISSTNAFICLLSILLINTCKNHERKKKPIFR